MALVNKSNSPKCFQCGAELILISKVTETLEGYHFPQTTTVYRCSDVSCQEEKDKQKEKRVKLQEEKARSDAKRAEQKQQDSRPLP